MASLASVTWLSLGVAVAARPLCQQCLMPIPVEAALEPDSCSSRSWRFRTRVSPGLSSPPAEKAEGGLFLARSSNC